MDLFIYILLTALIGFFVGRYRAHSLQNRGEALLASRAFANFPSPNYHLMNNVTLPFRGSTTQVDHILVSRFGVFVIETKDYQGWIFANPQQASWTQVLFKKKFKFQNPIHQNYKHVSAVRSILDFLPPETIHSVVVFTGEAEFKTPLPEGVFDLNGFINHIKAEVEEVVSENRMQFCVGRLETKRLALTKQTDIEHVQRIQRKYGIKE